MAYKAVPGGIGRIYVAGSRAGAPKKHNCKDCFFCQWCAEERCRLCRKKESSPAQEMNVNPRFRPPSARTLLRQTLRAALIGLVIGAAFGIMTSLGSWLSHQTDRPPALPGLIYIIRGLDVSAFPGMTIMTAIDRRGVEPKLRFFTGRSHQSRAAPGAFQRALLGRAVGVAPGMARPDLRALAHAVRLVGLVFSCVNWYQFTQLRHI